MLKMNEKYLTFWILQIYTHIYRYVKYLNNDNKKQNYIYKINCNLAGPWCTYVCMLFIFQLLIKNVRKKYNKILNNKIFLKLLSNCLIIWKWILWYKNIILACA